MKKIFFLTLFFPTVMFAQAPSLLSYQTVIWDTGNNLVVNQLVGVQFSILQGTTLGPSVYVETHGPTTNMNGLATLQIGGGATLSGDIATIDWSNGPYFLKTEVDPTGGTSYTITSTHQLLSVPYALYAKVADSVVNDMVDDADPDPSNEIQTISQVGNVVTLSNGGGSVTFTSLDDDPTNELNTSATLVGTDLSITDAGGTLVVDLSSLVSTPGNPTDELQDLSFANDTVYISNGIGTYIGPEDPIFTGLNAPITNAGLPWGDAAYYKDHGRVYLQGTLTNSSPGLVIFNLPVGYRPAKNVIVPTLANGNPASITISPNGDVIQSSGAAAGTLYLDGLSFRISN